MMTTRASTTTTATDLTTAELRAIAGAAIRDARENLRLSQRAFARRARIDQASISRIERGEMAAGPTWRTRIAAALGAPEDVLFHSLQQTPPELRFKRDLLTDTDACREILTCLNEVLAARGAGPITDGDWCSFITWRSAGESR